MEQKNANSSLETENFKTKVSWLKKKFDACSSPEKKYQLLIELGKKLPPLPQEQKKQENLVSGCQSLLYLHAENKKGLIFFFADTDALISKGLAAILIEIYNGEPLETLFKCPPLFLQTLGIQASLSPNRSAGLSSIYLKMKQLAIKP